MKGKGNLNRVVFKGLNSRENKAFRALYLSIYALNNGYLGLTEVTRNSKTIIGSKAIDLYRKKESAHQV